MKPLVLCILDGVGIREETHGNAVYKANMPTFKRLLNEYPNCLLEASGTAVGLPAGQMGNSEVGHTNIGAGRVIYQPLELINQKVEKKEIFDNKNILEVMYHVKENKSKLHIMGLLSDGGIHSHINHLFALLDMCKKNKIDEVCLHLFLDGRDTLPTEGLKYLNQLNDKINILGIGKICTISGRYYAMDRDNNYDRLEKAYNAIVYGKGEKYDTYEEAIKANLDRDITDEFTIPCVINEEQVNDNDGIIIFNFRPDRLREIGYSLTNPNFDNFPHKNLSNIKLLTMMPVSEDVICTNAYELEKLDNTFGEYISKKGLTQLRIAETEKYAHVTYFFDGGVERKLRGSKRTLIASPKVATYDLMPEMSAKKITSSLLKQMNKVDVVILNFANGDMVGHTGNMDATVEALEVLDECLSKIYNKIVELGGLLVITADHGNSDYMLDDNDNPVTSHSTFKVPLIITDNSYSLHDGKLADIAPTLLTLLDLPIPKEMTGECLLEKKKEKKDNSKQGKIFRILSIIFIVCFFGIYGYRFVHFYRESHTKQAYKQTNIIEKLDTYKIKTSGNGLYNCDGDKCFKGEVANNYLFYRGFLWRIVSYTNDGVRLISDESLTILKPNYDNNNYIQKWIDNLRAKYANDSYIKSVSLLSSTDYSNTVVKSSYLNNGTNWYTNDNKYVNLNGDVSELNDGIYSIRVVITISKDAVIIAGDGSIASNYKIVESTPNSLQDVDIGTYVKFSERTWRVVDKNSTGIKLALNDLLDEKVYSNKNDNYNIYNKNSVAYYLNNDFYDSLDTKKILSAKWNVVMYNEVNKYNYAKVNNVVSAHVGLLSVGDLFLNDFNEYTLLTEENNDHVYKVNPYGILFLDLKSSSRKVRPAIYLAKDNIITKGEGNKESPYILGE